MKLNNLRKSMLALLLISSPLVGAEEYPAADYQPKVLYQDTEYKPQPNQAPVSKNAESVTDQNSTEYPATNFQPKVLYKDEAYKPSSVESVKLNGESKAAPASAKTADKSDAVTEISSGSPAAITEQEGGLPIYPLALVVLGVLGFLFYKKRADSAPVASKKEKAPVSSRVVAASGLTGVSKYLNRVSGTGVSRYLDKRVKTATVATGVAKYVAKQVINAKTVSKPAAQTQTGVEKYVRNRRP